MCLLCFFYGSLDVPGVPWVLTSKSQFRGPPNLSCFSPVFFSTSPRLMEDNKACMKIVSVFIGSHSEDGKRISVVRKSCSRLFLWVRIPSPSLSQWEQLVLSAYADRKEFL